MLGAVFAGNMLDTQRTRAAPDALFPFRLPGQDKVFVSFAAEFTACFIFFFIILRCCASKANKGNNVVGIIIGATLTFGLFFCGTYSGGAMNPAVALAIWVSNVIQGFQAKGEYLAFFLAYNLAPILAALFANGLHYVFEDIWNKNLEEAEADADEEA